MKRITDPSVIRDLTGIEMHLLKLGFSMLASSTHFNTYDGVCRMYSKEGYKDIHIGIVDDPARIGLYWLSYRGRNYLPEPENFEDFVNYFKKIV